jgi:hypothetical protein
MIRAITNEDIAALNVEFRDTIEKGLAFPGLTMISIEDGAKWAGGFSETSPGTGELWICPIKDLTRIEWKEIKDFYFWARDAYGFHRIQAYILPNETGQKTKRMVEHLGLTKESTMLGMYNGEDVEMFVWVRKCPPL